MARKRMLARQPQDQSLTTTSNNGSNNGTTKNTASNTNHHHCSIHPRTASSSRNSHHHHHDDDDVDDWKTRHAPKKKQRKWKRLFLLGVSSAVLLLLLLATIVPRCVFNASRILLMGRPVFLYGSPTDWKDVEGCLKTQQRQQPIKNANTIRRGGNSNPPQKARLRQPPLDPDNAEWNATKYSSSHNNATSDTPMQPKWRLLIAQYSGKGSYERMLRETEPINRAYARKWGHDYTTLVGTGLRFPGLLYHDTNNDDKACKYRRAVLNNNSTTTTSSSTHHQQYNYNYEAQSTFNKIPLLFHALNSHDYDQVLILDADAMIVDFDYDITSMLHTNTFLVALRVHWFDPESTWDINAGVTLWNLRHPLTRAVAEEWLQLSLDHPRDVLEKSDDQYFLQRALLQTSNNAAAAVAAAVSRNQTRYWDSIKNWWHQYSFLPAMLEYVFAVDFGNNNNNNHSGSTTNGIRAVRNEFDYYDGTVIRHFKRDTSSWSRTGLEQRLLQIRTVKSKICHQWPDDCYY